jgi:hypothetical protein
MTMGRIVGGDLYHLWRVSDVHLPRIADVYYDANRTLNGGKSTSTGPFDVTYDTEAFRESTPAYPGATAMSSPVAAAWADLRDEMQIMYAQIGETVLNAAEGVRRATQAYIDADLINADALTNYMADPANHDPTDPASNPPAPGSAEYPGEPVLPG